MQTFWAKTLRFFFLIYSCCIYSLLFGQREENRIENAILWQISGNGLSQPSYICGTLHAICISEISFSDTLVNCIRNSNAVFLEINAKKDSTIAKTNHLQNKLLSELIGRRHFEKLIRVINGYNSLTNEKLDSLQPFFVKSLLTEAAMNCKAISIDRIVLSIARKYNISTSSIESFEEHYQPVMQIPLNIQASLLKLQIDNFEKFKDRNNEEIVLYKRAEVNEIYLRSAYNQFMERKNGVEEFLDKRNFRWVEFISKNCQNGQSFFAFGCAHLSGNSGVINLLRKKGYVLTPIFNVIKDK